MEVCLQELIDQIKKDGVTAAETKAQDIISTANTQAEKIIVDAKAQADKLLLNAKAENERTVFYIRNPKIYPDGTPDRTVASGTGRQNRSFLKPKMSAKTERRELLTIIVL